MRLLGESSVLPEEIDTLGHMNVRYYLQRVLVGHETLMAELGLGREVLVARKAILTRADTYIRYHREQLSGARLEVLGGLLAASETGLKMFYEVRCASGDPAATFVIDLALEDRPTRRRLPVPAETIALADALRVPLPAHGEPRSLTLEPPRLDLSFADIEARVKDMPNDNTMLGIQMERTVEPQDCDVYGFMREGEDLMYRAHRAVEGPAGGTFGPPIQLSDEGHRFGWAWLETRSIQGARPRLGDVLRSIPAEIGLQRKTRHTRRWIFNMTTSRLAGIEDCIGIALDIDARRSIEIPTTIREALETRFVPEFA